MKINISHIFTLSLALCLFCIVGCSGATKSFGAKIQVPAVPVGAATRSEIKLQNASVAIDEVKDGRHSPALVEYSSGSSLPEGSIADSIKTALSETLTAGGLSVTDSAPLIISIEVREWLADSRNLTTKSDAAIALQLFDPANKLMYSGVYRGHAEIRKSSLQESELRETLGIAMSEAISQIIKDDKLMRLIASF